MSEIVTPFDPTVDDAVLDDLYERIDRAIWPDQLPGTGWEYGTDLGYLRELCDYWRDDFDWRAAEARLGRWPHHVTEIDGQRIHFIHARSPEADATPLLVAHGWPGSVSEFLDVVEPLRDPRSHGGDPADAFHVVVPSLPGFGWSSPTTERGWDTKRMARALVELMARLGYGRYAVQGGDLGAFVTQEMARIEPSHVVGVHANFFVALADVSDLELTAQELADLDAPSEYLATGSAYMEVQGKNPATIAPALTDSPIGLASWIVEKFWAWTYHDGDLESAVSKDQMLTNITLYWVTRSYAGSARSYFENRVGSFGIGEPIPVPVGLLVCPGEIMRPPERVAERALDDLVHYTRAETGGHFAALEVPDLFVDDVRATFATLRARS